MYPSCFWCFAMCPDNVPRNGKLQPKTESRIHANNAAVRETFVWEMYWKLNKEEYTHLANGTLS